jgi:hypothetical protein
MVAHCTMFTVLRSFVADPSVLFRVHPWILLLVLCNGCVCVGMCLCSICASCLVAQGYVILVAEYCCV